MVKKQSHFEKIKGMQNYVVIFRLIQIETVLKSIEGGKKWV